MLREMKECKVYRVVDTKNEYMEDVEDLQFFKYSSVFIMENYNHFKNSNEIDYKNIALFALTMDTDLEEKMIIEYENKKYKILHVPPTYRNNMKISLFIEEVV